MKGQNYKDFESQVRTAGNHDQFDGVRRKLGEYGIQPTNMISISDGIKPCKHLLTYLIFKCRRVYEKGLSVVYYSQGLGYIVHMKEFGDVFAQESTIQALRLDRLDNPKEFYAMIS